MLIINIKHQLYNTFCFSVEKSIIKMIKRTILAPRHLIAKVTNIYCWSPPSTTVLVIRDNPDNFIRPRRYVCIKG